MVTLLTGTVTSKTGLEFEASYLLLCFPSRPSSIVSKTFRVVKQGVVKPVIFEADGRDPPDIPLKGEVGLAQPRLFASSPSN